MKRRTLLTAAVSASAATVAGCVGRAFPAGGDGVSPGGNATDGEGASDVALAGTQFAVQDVSCGTQTSEATVAREPSAPQVVVEGTISAPNPCYTARLGDVTYDASAGVLRVPVATEKRPDVDVCTQCIAEIQYRAVAAFRGGLPVTVVVTHDGEVVAKQPG